jgi:hypothetical protein
MRARGDHGHPSSNQFSRQLWQPIHLILSPAVVDRDVLALNIASVFEAAAKRAHTIRIRLRRPGVEEPDHRHRRLLRPPRERPRGGRASEHGDEIAPFHCPVPPVLGQE